MPCFPNRSRAAVPISVTAPADEPDAQDSPPETTYDRAMRRLSLSIVFGCLGSWLACQSPITCENSYTISAASRSGCRAPDEPGCASCCYGAPGDGSCTRRSWAPGGAGVSSVKPWYNAAEFLAQSCPADCLPCASCLAREEEELCQLLAMPRACDCAHTEIGIDPCFHPESCACYCERLALATQSCPAQ